MKCAVAVQELLRDEKDSAPVERRLLFRIGVHVGDVMLRGADLLGDAINIAARLQSLADPGGVCISGVTHDFVRKTLPLNFDDLALQNVKNIDEPIHARGTARSSVSNPACQCSGTETGTSATRPAVHCRFALCQRGSG